MDMVVRQCIVMLLQERMWNIRTNSHTLIISKFLFDFQLDNLLIILTSRKLEQVNHRQVGDRMRLGLSSDLGLGFLLANLVCFGDGFCTGATELIFLFQIG